MRYCTGFDRIIGKHQYLFENDIILLKYLMKCEIYIVDYK